MQNKEELLETYRVMSRIRAFEDRLHEENLTGDIPGFIHLSPGHEAIAIGVCNAVSEQDYFALHHRGHGHCIARGSNVNDMMCEIFGKKGGICGGKGGSMHIADMDRGILGANGIVGMSGPLGIGAALAAKCKKLGGVGLAFAGDGASNQGLIFEALNLAVVLNLPCIFIFENNGFSEFTGHDYAVGSKDIAGRAAGFGLPAVKIDGTDYFAVYEATTAAVSRARNGEGPSVIEAVTVRRYGHFEGDAMEYRSKEEINEIRNTRDPLVLFRERTANDIDEGEFNRIDEEAKLEIDEAVTLARSAPPPPLESLMTDVYVSY